MKTGMPEVDRYLLMRRRTRWLRRIGGPVLAVLGVAIAIVLMWQASSRSPVAAGATQIAKQQR
jgi:hypothetical protein